MIRRRVFYSFHYAADSWRAATVRNIGVVEGNQPATDNGWEEVKRGGDAAIKKWIDNQMKYRSCTLVLVGAGTADRRWINYEIERSWTEGMGLAGIRIHGLLDQDRIQSFRGRNPFARFNVRNGLVNLASIVKCHDPPGTTARERYGWIRENLADIVETAIRIRREYP